MESPAPDVLSISRRTTLSALTAALLAGTVPASADRAPATSLDSVPLTPRPDSGPDAAIESLNGTWDFTLAGAALRPDGPRLTTPDRSANGNDGVLVNGASLVDGPFGKAVDLDGDAYGQIGGDDLNVTDPGLTIRLRFRYTGDTALVSKGNRQYAGGVYDGSLAFWTAGDGDWPTVSGGNLTPGEWYTATFVIDDTVLKLAVDGEVLASEPHESTTLPSTDGPLHLGYNAANGTLGDLVIDSIAVFDRALEADEIASRSAVPFEDALTHLTFEETAAGDGALGWRSEPVPGQWGYDSSILGDTDAWYPSAGLEGRYRRTFELPEGWGDGRVLLRFDAVYSHARVSIDGAQIADHDGGYTPFEVDVTDHLDGGRTHELVVAVAQHSASDEMAWGNVTGGITRDVTLVAVPDCHLSELFVRTEVETGGSAATVTAETTVENFGTTRTDEVTLAVDLRDPEGGLVGTAKRELSALEAGETRASSLSIDITDPATWHPEQPHLHTLVCRVQTGETTERVSERVGIREVAVDGTSLTLNGEPITLRGVNWEEIHLPAHGQAVPPARTRADAELLAEANVNFVRTCHHPPSEAFVRACDELGIVLEVEAPHMFVGRQGGDPHPAVIRRQIAETVARDRNRPSVCLWSIANESAWGEHFADAERVASALDPTRPTIFEYHTYRPDQPWLDQFDVATDHYPAIRTGSTIADVEGGASKPVVFGEFGHTYTQNDRELVTDPGMRDGWGMLFERIWTRTRAASSSPGGAIWAGGDHASAWGQFLWGIVDRYRRPRPEYWHVKKVYSPVRIAESEWIDGGDRVELTVENRHDVVALDSDAITWESGDERGTLDSEPIPAGETGAVTVPVPGEDLSVTVIDSRGRAVETVRLTPPTPPVEDLGPASESSVTTSPSTVELTTPSLWVSVDRDSGHATISPADGLPVVVGGPHLALTPLQTEPGRDYDSAIDHRPSGRTVTGVRPTNDGAGIVVAIEYDRASCTLTLRPRESGLVVAYEATLRESMAVREAGVALQATSAHTTLSWVRNGQWTTYPADHVGRIAGTAQAFPGGGRPDSAAITLDPGRPWSEDATRHGSNDFRSTKRSVYQADLSADDGRRVGVRLDGKTHVRAQVRDDCVDFLALDRSLAGAGPEWIDRHAATEQTVAVEAGQTLSGRVTVQVSGADGPGTVAPGLSAPRTVDGDSALEDVTGDGVAVFNDVTSYLGHRRGRAIQSNPDLFDFDGDGDAGQLVDALALLDDVVDPL